MDDMRASVVTAFQLLVVRDDKENATVGIVLDVLQDVEDELHIALHAW